MQFVFSVIDRQQAMDLLRQDVTAVLEECHSRGMQLPYWFVAVSLDGKVMRYVSPKRRKAMAWMRSLSPAIECMPMPLIVMIVDATGQATCARISGLGQVMFRYS